MNKIVGIVTLLSLVIIPSYAFENKGFEPITKKTSDERHVYRTKSNMYYAQRYSALEKMFNCAGDDKALRQLIDEGSILPLKAGEEVYVLEKLDGGLKVRHVGSSDTFWVSESAVELKE